MNKWRKCGVAATVVLGASLAFGCSSQVDRQPNAVEPSIGPLAPVSMTASLALPLDAFGQSPQTKLLEAQARDILIGDCMRKAGATWDGDSVAFEMSVNRNIQRQREASFGLVDESKAAQFGYHGEPVSEPRESGSTSLPAYLQCSKELKLSMAGTDFPSVEDFDKAMTKLPAEAVARTFNDSRYLAMAKQWSECMDGKGYDFDSPEDASEEGNWRTDKPVAKELQTAVADVKCKQEVGYLPLVVALRIAYENQLIETNAEALQRVKEYYDRRAIMVADVIAGKK